MNELSAEVLVLIMGAVIALIFIVLLVWVISLSVKLKRLRGQYTAFMDGAGVSDLETVITAIKERAQLGEQRQQEQTLQIEKLEQAIPKMNSRVGVVRYNAFGDGGHELSFSLALVNDELDGVVLSGIYNRETTYVYAKPLEKGRSAYALTPEEIQSINEAK